MVIMMELMMNVGYSTDVIVGMCFMLILRAIEVT